MKLMDWLLGLSAAGLGLWLIFHAPALQWNEEVQLQTGEVIVIRRTAIFNENPMTGGGDESSNTGTTIEFKSPDKPDNPAMWRGVHVPMILDRDPDTHEWVIVATFHHCESWSNTGRPMPPYMAYRYHEGEWLPQSMEPKWIGRDANVVAIGLSDGRYVNGSNPIFTISDKKKLFLDRPEISLEYKKVIDKWSRSC
ncbi:MAG: hypothetical protein K2Q07_02415 [Burkholderiaceae bacterium]|nr:hypothetical protein [Burkholderiaceae bacterium]